MGGKRQAPEAREQNIKSDGSLGSSNYLIVSEDFQVPQQLGFSALGFLESKDERAEKQTGIKSSS